MERQNPELLRALAQQAAVAELGERALAGTDLDALTRGAVKALSRLLEVPAATAMEYLLLAGGPVIAEELATLKALTRQSRRQEAHGGRAYTEDDRYFVQSIGNVLAAAVRRRRDEERLRESRDQLEAILRGAADAIVVQDAQGRPVYVNDTLARLIDYPSASALLQSTREEVFSRVQIMDESGKPVRWDELPGRQVLHGAPGPSQVFRLQVTEGAKERWVLHRATPLLDAKGEVQYSVTIITDITEGKQREQVLGFLAEASRRLGGSLDYRSTQATIARLPVPFLADWCLVYGVETDGRGGWSAAAHGDPMKEHRLAEMLRALPEGAVWPLSPTEALETRKPVTSAPQPSGDLDPQASELLEEMGFASAMIAPMVARGRVLGAIAFVSIDPKHVYGPGDFVLVEELARRSGLALDNAQVHEHAQGQRRELQAILDSMTEAVISLDAKLRVSRANLFAHELLRAAPGSLEGKDCSSAVRVLDERTGAPVDLAAWMRECIKRKQTRSVDAARLELPFGRRIPIALTIAPQASDGDPAEGAVLLLRDVSRQREVEELRESIVSLASHELRAPLVHIKGFASSLLQKDVAWDEETRLDFIRTIDREADRLSRLVGSLLDVSALESGKLSLEAGRVTPASLIRGSVKQAQPSFKGHRVTVGVEPRLPPVKADTSHAERVLVNLLENAAKYSRPGTRIHVRAQARGPVVLFSVRDEGVGIPAEAHEKIFERFTRLAPQGIPQPPGAGLGLNLCKAIVSAHGGRIWVESAPGLGSTFFFTLPVWAEEKRATRQGPKAIGRSRAA